MTTRRADVSDQPFFGEMLVEAANPPWIDPRPSPAMALADEQAGRYLRGWGRPGDHGVIAEVDGRPIGAAWYRHFPVSEPGYGFVAEDVPEIAIAVVPEARAAGVGTELMAALVELARSNGERSLSLSVGAGHKVALRLYEGAGFMRVGGDDRRATMELVIQPLSRLVSWLAERLQEADPSSRRTAVFVDRDERAMVAFETSVWGPVVAKSGHDVAQWDREVATLRAARNSGGPVPMVHLAVDGDPTLLVLEAIDGIALGPASPAAAWRGAGEALRAIHSTPTAGLPSFGGDLPWPQFLAQAIDGEVTAIERAAALDPDEASWVRHHLSRALAISRADVLLHGDCAPEHFRIVGDEVRGVVDFGDAGVGDAVFDIAVLTLWHPGRLDDLLYGYQADAALRARVETCGASFRLLRHLAAARWLRERGYNPARHEAAAKRLVAAGKAEP